MLKFFRRIRQKMIKEGRLSRYFIYALGEILLVVIGILLALQVNNWNQNRKDLSAKDEAVRDLYQEFTTIKTDFEAYLNFLNKTLDEWDVYLKTITDPEGVNLEQLDYRPRSASRRFTPKNSVLLSILSTGKIDKIENKELKKALTGWGAFFSDYDFILEWHEQFYRNELGRVERYFQNTLIRTPDANKYKFPDYDKVESLKEALSDKRYQNLLLTQFDILKLKISEAVTVQQEIDQIIALLQKEITL